MTEKKTYLESNIQQLLQTAISIANKPDAQLKERTYGLLQKELGKPISTRAFSRTILVSLCALFVLMSLWLFLKISNDLVLALSDISLIIMGGILLLNLAAIPIAGFILVKRRRHA